MRDVDFSIVYLGSTKFPAKPLKFSLPKNVTDFREFYIFDYRKDYAQKKQINPDNKKFDVLENFFTGIRKNDTNVFDKLLDIMDTNLKNHLDINDIIRSFESWKTLERVYNIEAKDLSFLDYFWTWRFIYLPFFSLLSINLPPARVYHSVSTGYAGLVGAMAKIKNKRPFILTEHGIYTRERKIEISQADWIYSELAGELKVLENKKDFFKEWWINFFSFFSKVAYDKADAIITLYEGNRKIQIEEGAMPSKTRIIPNGVNFLNNNTTPDKHSEQIFRVGFMGRVVPIKDVKTFIRACNIVHKKLDNTEFFIMGPVDEDEAYYKDCLALAEMENLNGVLKFTGKVNTKEYYPKMDLIVLTSLSEGQPLVMLEAYSWGIPVVTTDVGACPELVYGGTDEDKLLGESGIITSVCNPLETAGAIIKILSDNSAREKMSKVAKTRVEKYYSMDEMIREYAELYNNHVMSA
ncbi:lipopolysaccharide N-acetylglucosaminyltransferase [Candidatus Omnitrophus magneticus]|uniref:Lipopolysaccharide N-acetylglucosaminyltransferase n=1 Tax=Candidatus Omnitrophus magneticus TaxID=1609969 RepID=A0A0F0CKV7_9BACT|nr:lipopolysaccharide N-acetylglucosaminyltransferase [Candidatus Omnitrophus magneticus]